MESLAKSKQAEMERTISLRQQGYRRRSFKLVDTNEGKDYIDEIRRIASSLSSAESSNFARFDTERKAALKRALSVTIIANSVLLLLAACLFGLIRHHGRLLGEEAAQSRNELAVRDLRLEKLNVCPFRSSAFQHHCHQYELPIAAGELRRVSSATGARICRADERSGGTNGTTPTRFSWQPKLRE